MQCQQHIKQGLYRALEQLTCLPQQDHTLDISCHLHDNPPQGEHQGVLCRISGEASYEIFNIIMLILSMHGEGKQNIYSGIIR